MSPVDFKKYQCRMSLSLIYAHVTCRIQEIALSHATIFLKPCRMSISSLSHVEFEKWPCRPVEFRGQWPSYCMFLISMLFVLYILYQLYFFVPIV